MCCSVRVCTVWLESKRILGLSPKGVLYCKASDTIVKLVQYHFMQHGRHLTFLTLRNQEEQRQKYRICY